MKSFNEFQATIQETYEEAKRIKDQLGAVCDEHSKKLQVFPRGPMGLTPDHVKASTEYKKATADYAASNQRAKAYNQLFLKKYKKEYAAERANRYPTV